jgi:serine/threonine-protein kinase/endoribonuclease IRE1
MAAPFRRQQGPGWGTAKKKVAFWALLAALTAAQYSNQDLIDERAPHSTSRENRAQQSRVPISAGRSSAESALPKLETTYAKHRNTHTSNNDDFMSALAPARVDDVVRAPPARNGQPSGLSSLPAARSLQDWEVEDFILVATIDGSLHALDRKNGKERWTLGNPESPMIETIHHRQNRSNNQGLDSDDEFMFIVEPNLDGSLYIQHKDPSIGLQRLDLTVRSLVDRSPQRTREPPLVFVARKEASMYTIDAATGNVKDFIDTTATYSSQDAAKGSCRRLSGFEIDEQDCEPAGVLHVGRTTHSVVIQDGLTREMICTIKYSEWTPNNGDQDLHLQYSEPFDNRRIHAFHDGQFIGLDLSGVDRRTKFHGKLDTPVARVWDVARPIGHLSSESSLAMFSPPTDPISLERVEWDGDQIEDKVFVNRTEAGWYAMSELRYPGITSQAKRAKIHTVGGLETRYLDFDADSDHLIGYHDLNVISSQDHIPLTISGPLAVSDLTLPPEGDVGTLSSLTTSSWMSQATSKYPAGILFILTMIFAFTFAKNMKPDRSSIQTHGKQKLEILTEKPLPDLPHSRSQSFNKNSLVSPVSGSQMETSVSDLASSFIDKSLPDPVPQEVHKSPTDMPKPRARQDSDGLQDQGSESESEDEAAENKSGDTGIGSRKRTRRGKRGARKSKKGAKKSMNPESVEDLMIVPERMQKDGEMIVGRLQIDTKICLGNGSSGTVVFPGQFDGREVAVKRIVRSTHSLAAKEIKHLLSSDENPHVIRYIGKEETTNFTYIALDRFTASLDQIIEHPERYPTLVCPPKGLDVKDALSQITDGVQHLHSLKLVHRDIKPQNVLVRAVKSHRPVIGQPKLQFVITDFGLCKTLDDGPNSTYAPTANHTAAGTSGWRAPELLVNSKASVAAPTASAGNSTRSNSHSSDGTTIDPPTGRRATKAIDIFSLGCVFFYIMTQGRHPFDVGGESLGRDLNIKENRSDLDCLRLYDYSFEADDLILQMLQHHPRHRPDTPTILLHPYFWHVDTKLDFLCDLSDRFEHEKLTPDSPHLAALEAQAPNVIGPTNDFLKALPKNFINEMGKQRKYTGSRMLDLLRVIRNKKNHFQDLPENVREMMMGGSAEGYFGFWGRRFPSLLVVCHALVLERGLVGLWRLERYF